VSARKVFTSPAIKVSKMRDMLERGEFAGYAQRLKAASKRISHGLPSAKQIEKRMRTIAGQLRQEA
jgi:hypothetical protein